MYTRPGRRELLRLAGLGVGISLAGCLDRPGDENGTNGDGPPDRGRVESVETTPFTVHTSRPAWDETDEIGRAILIDSDERQRAVLHRYDLSDSRRETIRDFLSGIDYGEERLLFVESAGPNACHDRLEIDPVRTENGEIHADAAVIDASDDETACAEVVTFPSALARIGFESEPLDSAIVEITDGWNETAAIHTTVDGAIGPDVDDIPGEIRPEGDATPIASLECDETGVRRHPQSFDETEMGWGNVERDGTVVLALRIEEPEYERGETARVRLTNVADRTVDTGNRAKYNLQAYTESGWEDVRVGDEDRPFAYTDEAIIHPPGDGFEWAIELTESGIAETTPHDHARVCPDLGPGRYRFVFWGVIGGAVAVAFDLR